MGSPDRSERTLRLRTSVLEAMARARDQYHGRVSDFIVATAAQAARDGLTKDDFYRATNADSIDKLSGSKLSRMQALLERLGLAFPHGEPGSELQRAVFALSRTSQPAEAFRRALPRSYLCLRRSYLNVGQINVSFVEMLAEDTTIHYRETRAGSLGAASQRAVLEGTILYPDPLADLYYVIGLNQFRTNFAVEEATSVRANMVSLSILRRLNADTYEGFHGIHAGVTPDNNPDFPSAPYAAKLLLIETGMTLAAAARAGLVQSHAATQFPNLAGIGAAERQLLKRHFDPTRLANDADPTYGLLIVPAARRLSQRRPRKA